MIRGIFALLRLYVYSTSLTAFADCEERGYIMTNLTEMGKKAEAAKLLLQKLSADEKNRGLKKAAEALVQNTNKILDENKKDTDNAINHGMNEGFMSPQPPAAMSVRLNGTGHETCCNSA